MADTASHAAPVEVKTAAAPPAPVADRWQSFRDEMDRLFDRFAGTVGVPSLRRFFDREPAWPFAGSFGFTLPAVDMTEGDAAYTLTAELPGLAQSDIEVTIADTLLTLKGEKRQDKEQKDANRYFSERSYGAFQRQFLLPDGIDRDKIKAEFAKGVLTVTLPKTTAAPQSTKKIEVKAAA